MMPAIAGEDRTRHRTTDARQILQRPGRGLFRRNAAPLGV